MTKGRWPIVLFGFVLLFLVSAITIAVSYILFYEPIQTNKSQPSVLVIGRDSSAKSIIVELKSKNLIKHDKLFLNYIRIFGLTKQLKAGVYEVLPSQTPNQLIRSIVQGRVLKKNFQIIEGTNSAQVFENLNNAEYLNNLEDNWFVEFSKSNHIMYLCDTSEICINTLSIDNIVPPAEGLFLADTYQYNAGSNGLALLSQAHENLKKHLIHAWENRSSSLPYKNPYELLIAASILEKESAIAHERRLISGVIVNRLAKNMPLQMDPTVIYGLGSDYTGKLTHANLHKDSKYNTYLHRGLPPTPITMVSKIAIDAASNPEKTNYLYFVAKGDGSHIFSTTYSEQKNAIKKYLGNLNG